MGISLNVVTTNEGYSFLPWQSACTQWPLATPSSPHLLTQALSAAERDGSDMSPIQILSHSGGKRGGRWWEVERGKREVMTTCSPWTLVPQ